MCGCVLCGLVGGCVVVMLCPCLCELCVRVVCVVCGRVCCGCGLAVLCVWLVLCA